VNALQDVLTIGGVPRQNLPPIVKRLKAWRERNGLSRRVAAEVMSREGYSVTEEVIRSWEDERRVPTELTQKALEAFLDQHPRIKNPPRYGRWVDKGRDKPAGPDRPK
jgi:ribosome-binding protein aMBF1 (putative translation factor)